MIFGFGLPRAPISDTSSSNKERDLAKRGVRTWVEDFVQERSTLNVGALIINMGVSENRGP